MRRAGYCYFDSTPLTVLLLGISEIIPTGHGPFLDHLRSLGWRAVVCAQHIDDRLRVKAWKVIDVSPRSPDAVIKVIGHIKIHAILPLTDDAVLTAATLGEIWNLPHPSISACKLSRSKANLKKRLRLHDIPTPLFETASFEVLRSSLVRPSLPAPWILKPSRSEGGSVGVFAASSDAELIKGLNEHELGYAHEEVVIERLLRGTEHSMEVIICDGNARIISISDKFNYDNHPSVVQSLVFPGPIGWMHFSTLRNIVERLPSVLEVEFGIMHIEFIVTQEGPWLIDLSLRPGGSYNLHPIPFLTTGYDYVDILLSILSGKNHAPSNMQSSRFIAWHFFDPCLLKKISPEEVSFIRNEADVIAIELLRHPCHPSRNLLQDSDRPGYVMVSGSCPKTAMVRARMLANKLYE